MKIVVFSCQALTVKYNPLKYTFFIIFFFSTYQIHSQGINGKVTDSANVPVPFISIALMSSADSSIVKGVMADENGKYRFNNLRSGKYFIKISDAYHKEKLSPVFEFDSLSSLDLETFILLNNDVNLNEVSITAIKQLIEFKNGNIIVNISDSPLSVGNSVYDLLSRLPGVTVDDERIMIRGKDGVKVYFDDRLLQMSGSQLVSFLKGINSSNIENIEIISNPSAKYDASGSTGIINVKTKKVKTTGFSGALNYTYSQGFYYTNDGGISLNYKGKKILFFSSINAFQGKIRSINNFNKVISSNSIDQKLNQKAIDVYDGKYLTLNIGADWNINSKNTIGVKAQFLPGDVLLKYSGNIEIVDTTKSNLNFNRDMPNTWIWTNYNLNAEHLFDTLGTKLRFSADYFGPYYDIYKSDYTNMYSLNGNVTENRYFKGNNLIDLKIFTSKLDFEKKIFHGINLEAGLKYSNQSILSDYSFKSLNNQTGIYELNNNYTNTFSYKELNAAAYFNVSKRFKKTNFQFGLRGENTNIQTNSSNKAFNITRNYFKLFPIFTLDYTKTENSYFSFAYNKRINRPDYTSFNPYRVFINEFNSSEGNPYILPEFAHNISLNHVYKNKLVNTISLSTISHPIQGYSSQNDSTSETIIGLTNLNVFNNISYTVFFTHGIKKWWNVSFNAGIYYNYFAGTINGEYFTRYVMPYSLWTSNQFLLKKDIKIELSALYLAATKEGIYSVKSRGSINVAVTKLLLKEKLSLTLAFNDILYTMPNRTYSDFQNQNWQRFEANDTRRLNFSISYNFGKIKAEQRIDNSSEEEKKRLIKK